MSNPAAVIFDFDGLICDTELPEFQAWQEIFESFGVAVPNALTRRLPFQGADLTIDSLESVTLAEVVRQRSRSA